MEMERTGWEGGLVPIIRALIQAYGEVGSGEGNEQPILMLEGLISGWRKPKGGDYWFATLNTKRLGIGDEILFREKVWVGDQPLKALFFCLHALSKSKEIRFSEPMDWALNLWAWSLRWRRSLWSWEEEAEEELLNLIGGVEPKQDTPYKWKCIPDICRGFTVKNRVILNKFLISRHTHENMRIYSGKLVAHYGAAIYRRRRSF